MFPVLLQEDAMPRTMPQDDFYANVRRGGPALIGQWLALGRGDAGRLGLILAETARVAKLGQPEATPDGATLAAWSEPDTGDEPPLWAAQIGRASCRERGEVSVVGGAVDTIIVKI